MLHRVLGKSKYIIQKLEYLAVYKVAPLWALNTIKKFVLPENSTKPITTQNFVAIG